MTSPNPPSQRQLQVGEELKHIISDIFIRNEFYGPKGESISITVSEVRISPDLRNATVYFMPLGGKGIAETQALLTERTPEIRHIIGKNIRLRHLPALLFRIDETFEKAAKMHQLLEDAKRS